MRRLWVPGLSRFHQTGKRGRAGRMAVVCMAVWAAAGVGGLRPALAAIPCGEQPEIVPEAAVEEVKLDTAEKANAILQAPPSANLRVLVKETRRELRAKFAKVDKLTIDHYLLWVTCQTISDDRSLAASQKFDQYSIFTA